MGHYLHFFENSPEYRMAKEHAYKEPWVSVTKNVDNRCDIISITINGTMSSDAYWSKYPNLVKEDFTTHDYDGEYMFCYVDGGTAIFSSNTTNMEMYTQANYLPLDMNNGDIVRKTCKFFPSGEENFAWVDDIKYGMEVGNKVNYNESREGKIADHPLTFEITSPGYINFVYAYGNMCTLQYSKNGGEWTEIVADNVVYWETGRSSNAIDVVSGDIVEFKGNNQEMCGDYWGYGSRFAYSTCGFKVYGNLLSIVFDNYMDYKDWACVDTWFMFPALFQGCTGLTDASDLILPPFAADGSFENMFEGCTSLVAAPIIKDCFIGTVSYSSPFSYMFNGCSSLNRVVCLCTNTDKVSYYKFLADAAPNGTLVVAGCEVPITRGTDDYIGYSVPLSWKIVDPAGNDITDCFPISD